MAPASSGGRFKCPECGETFKAARALSSHRHYKHDIQSVPRGRRYLETSAAVSALSSVADLEKEVKRLLAVEQEYKALKAQLQELSESLAFVNPRAARMVKSL